MKVRNCKAFFASFERLCYIACDCLMLKCSFLEGFLVKMSKVTAAKSVLWEESTGVKQCLVSMLLLAVWLPNRDWGESDFAQYLTRPWSSICLPSPHLQYKAANSACR